MNQDWIARGARELANICLVLGLATLSGLAQAAGWGADYFPNVTLTTHNGRPVKLYDDLLKGKKVYVALARGGLYRDTPADSQTPYLKSVLAFLGMTDVEFIFAEGLAMGAESANKAFAEAEARIEEIFA